MRSASEEASFVVSEITRLVKQGKVPGGYQEVALDPAPKELASASGDFLMGSLIRDCSTNSLRITANPLLDGPNQGLRTRDSSNRTESSLIPGRIRDSEILVTEFIEEVSSLLPSPCHFQNHDLLEL